MTIAPQSTGSGFTPYQYAVCLGGIAWRETLRFLHQRERFRLHPFFIPTYRTFGMRL